MAAGRPAGYVLKEHGEPVYFHLTTRDYAKALDFYRTVFGWRIVQISDSDEFRYSTAVFDVDTTIALTLANGGRVINEAKDTAYGRLANAADPTGAASNLSSL